MKYSVPQSSGPKARASILRDNLTSYEDFMKENLLEFSCGSCLLIRWNILNLLSLLIVKSFRFDYLGMGYHGIGRLINHF